MKKQVLLLFLLVATFVRTNGQTASTFKLSDTSFTNGAILNPICDVWFNLDSHYHVRSESKPCLDSFALLMKKYPGMIVEIGAHTDQRGSDSTNLWWSQRRAERVKEHLLSCGIEEWRIAAVGYGETQPIIKEDEILKVKIKEDREPLYQKNRRIEFKILYLYPDVFNLSDTAFEKGSVMRPYLLFDFNKPTLRPEFLPWLDSMAHLMQLNDSMKIEIHGHTDTRSSVQYSSCLSCSRAKTIRDSLIARGIAPARITHRGYQGQAPIISPAYINKVPGKEGQEQLHMINRRIEIRVIQVK